jgi:hypothetical protein
MNMNVSPAAASLAATALVLILSACSRETPSEPEMAQPAPDESAYTGGAGRKEDGPAADTSASGEPQQDPPSAPQQ